jgi:hypothetical protein
MPSNVTTVPVLIGTSSVFFTTAAGNEVGMYMQELEDTEVDDKDDVDDIVIFDFMFSI